MRHTKMTSNNVDVAKTLEERGDRYGRFVDNAYTSAYLQTALQSGVTYKRLRGFQREALNIIFQKISRIVNGDPDYKDNWVDIAGYATLVAKELNDE
jgi:hypothetical protein